MKKNFTKFLAFLCLMVLGGVNCAWGATETIFSLTVTNGNTASIDSKKGFDVTSEMATIVGGTAYLYNGKSSAAALMTSTAVNLGGSGASYLKITLSGSEKLQEDDVITISTLNAFKLTSTDSNSNAVQTDASTGSYTVTSSDILKGKNTIYVWKTSGTSTFTSVTITRTIEEIPTEVPSITKDLDATYETDTNTPVTFAITAEGAQSYQWYTCDDLSGTNPVAISDATSAKLTHTFTVVGTYYVYCAVTNIIGTTNTSIATVNVAESKYYSWMPTGAVEVTGGSGTSLISTNSYVEMFLNTTVTAEACSIGDNSSYPFFVKTRGETSKDKTVDITSQSVDESKLFVSYDTAEGEQGVLVANHAILVVKPKENGNVTITAISADNSDGKKFFIRDNTENVTLYEVAMPSKAHQTLTFQAQAGHTYLAFGKSTGMLRLSAASYTYAESTELTNVKIGDVELSAADLATLNANKTIAINDFISTTGAPVITAEGGVTFTNDGNNVYTATSWGETYTIDLSGCTFINGDALLSSCKYKVIDNKKTAITEPAAGFANENIAAIQVGTYGMTGQAPNGSTNLSNTNTFKVGWNTTIGFTCTDNDKIRAIKVTGVSATAEGKAHKFTLASADENSEAVITTPTDNMLNGSTTVGDDVLILVDEAGLGEQFNLKFDGWFESFVTFTVYYDEVQKATISAGGYTTFCPIYSDVTIPENVTAYTAKINDAKDAVVLTKVEGGKLPQGCGVVLAGAKSTEYTFVPTTDAADLASDNQMVGATEDVEIENVYVLGVKDGVCVFGKWDGTNGLFPAGKAYLNVTSTLAKTLRVVFDDDNETTGINNAATEKAQDGAIFNLAGQKVSANYKGIVIINGKKALVK